MPRKATKTAKPPLLFLEPPLRGARFQDVSEVRAAFNPKECVTEKREHNSAHNSWVSPQFNCSVAAPPERRGRKKCHSSTSASQSDLQPPKKSSVCKFPSLTFQARARDEPCRQKSTNAQTVTECTAAVSDAGNQPKGPRQIQRAGSSTRHRDAPERQTTSIRKRNTKRCPASAACSSSHSGRPETQSVPTDGTPIRVSGAVSCVAPPPDVHTPKVSQEGSCYPSFTSQHVLLPQSSTPPDILVTDTPERDYGVKVTWRRRRELMLLLKERDLLSDSEILVHT
ncbi:RAD9, HUS1, RAD1-interacting nuclear orphan protein 1-like [Brachionichthys hirsutus]|uniref:RAD9, HUS1, RAD1-interacting nuclear orphan protein 1-like n=1 Tax=Brachionichthys hirsutus TaxID=412623 RepID=UPI003604F9D3